MQFNIEKWLISLGEDLNQYTEGIIKQTTRDGKRVFCLFSKKTNRNLGCFPTREQAKNREREVQVFKKTRDSKSYMPELNKDKKIEFVVEDLVFLSADEVDNEKLSSAGIKRNKDLLYARFKLCHEGANANKDLFTFSELQSNFDTALFKPINWEHDSRQIIGCIYDSHFISENTSNAADFKPHIICDGVVYKFRFPAKAQVINDRFDRGDLKFSMEAWFEDVECSECGESFQFSREYCDHLNNRKSNGSDTNRILRGVTFGGAAVVENPADINADGLSIARRILADETIEFMVNDIRSFDDLSAVMQGFVNKLRSDELVDEDKMEQKIVDLFSKFVSINNMPSQGNEKDHKGGSNVDNDKKYTEDELNSKLEIAVKAALEEYKSKSDIEGKIAEAEQKIEAKEAEIDKLKEEKDEAIKASKDVKKEFEELKAQLEKDKLCDERMTKLEKANISFPEEKLSEVKKQVSDMSEDAFALYFDTLQEMAVKIKDNENDKDKETNSVTASTNLPNVVSEESKGRLEKLDGVLVSMFDNNNKKENE